MCSSRVLYTTKITRAFPKVASRNIITYNVRRKIRRASGSTMKTISVGPSVTSDWFGARALSIFWLKICLLCSSSTYDDPRLIRCPNVLLSTELLLGLSISSLDQLGSIRFDICFDGTLLALLLLVKLWLFVCYNATAEFTYITNKRPLKETG